MKRTLISVLLFIIIIIAYFPLISYYKQSIIKSNIKEAFEYFMKDICQQTVQVMDVELRRSWSNFSWNVTTEPEVKNINGEIIQDHIYLDMSNVIQCKYSNHLILDDKTHKFVPDPMNDYVKKISYSIPIFIFILFAGSIGIILLYVYESRIIKNK